jgi:hypothetical protein
MIISQEMTVLYSFYLLLFCRLESQLVQLKDVANPSNSICHKSAKVLKSLTNACPFLSLRISRPRHSWIHYKTHPIAFATRV